MAKFISEKIKMKSGARLAAVQATYMIAYGDLPVDEVVKDFVNGEVGRYVIEDNGITEEMIAVSDIDTNYFSNLVRGVHAKKEDLEKSLNAYLNDGWLFERMDGTLQALLLCAIYEITNTLDVDVKVLILAFTIVVHVATVFSTLVILWKEIEWIFRGLFKFKMNAETRYVINILISMIPIGIVGVFFKDTVEDIFGSGLLIVGCMLLLTAALLAFSYYAKPRQKESISMKDAFIIGLAQACAVMPGLSRSGTTIATGLLLGNNKAKLAQFSFLMVIPPILGEALLDVMKAVKGEAVAGDIPALSLVVGFIAAFVSGCIACKWMINIVKKGKLIYFAIYCAIAGLVTIACTLLK